MQDLLECEWKNTQGKPCLIITKTQIIHHF